MWDYKEIVVSGLEMLATAKKEGKDGWELATATPLSPSDYRLRLIFKREIPETSTQPE